MTQFLKSLYMLILTYSCLTPLQLCAQANERQISFIHTDHPPKENLYLKQKGSYTKIAFKPSLRSRLYSVRKTPSAAIYRKTDSAEKKYTVAFQITYPEKTNRALCIITPIQEKPLDSTIEEPIDATVEEVFSPTYSTVVTNDNVTTFPSNSFGFLNLTEKSLNITLADRHKEAPINELVTIARTNKSGAFDPFFIKTLEGKTLYLNRLLGQHQLRELVIISPSKKNPKRLRLKFISENVQ